MDIHNPLIERYGADRRWVVWRKITRGGKPTKAPFQATGAPADSTKPNTWADYASVTAAAPRFDGVGIVFAPDRLLLGVDLDHKLERGEIADESSARFVEAASTYTEISPSGAGLHVFFELSEPLDLTRNKDPKRGVEAYSRGRYFTFTGKPYGDAKPLRAVTPAQALELLALLSPIWQATATTGRARATIEPAHVGGPLGDADLLARMFASRAGAKARALWDGDTTAYSSPSEADLALLDHLGFWTGYDESRTRALFLASALGQREKAQREDYLTRSIAKAFTGKGPGDGYNRRPRRTDRARVSASGSGQVNGTNGHADGEGRAGNMGARPEASAGPDNDSYLLTCDADDAGNADAIAIRHKREFLYCDAYGWLAYSGRHWQRESAEARVREAAKETLRARQVAAAKANNQHVVKATSPSAKHIRDALWILQSGVTVSVSTFDSEPHLVNCAGGVLDLRTSQRVAHESSQRFTYCLPTEYDPNADRTEFLNFLYATVAWGKSVVDWLLIWLGYCLTGDTRLEQMLYIFGPTRAGKGTLIEAVLHVMGDLAASVDFGSFTARRDNDAQNFDLAPLKHARFVTAGESNAYQTLNAAKLKQLTGGDRVTAAFKHRDMFTYRPQYKIALVSNHSVNADVDDDAVWARLCVVEFPHSHLGHEDTMLKARMKSPENARAILACLVEGAAAFYKAGARGIQAPDEVAATTRKQRDALDYVQQWLDQCCLRASESWTANESLYQSYAEWCRGSGIEPKQQRGLSTALQRKGFTTGEQHKAGGTNKRGVSGLGLLDIRTVL